MNILSRHLCRQILATLSMTMAVFLFVMLLGEGMKDALTLLVRRDVSPLLALKAMGLLIPFILAYALPMGLLTATLLVFGRFSADQELTAARANGLSLMSLLPPVLVVGILCSGLSAGILLDLAPRSRVAFKQMFFDYVKQRPEELLTSGALLESSGDDGFWIYVRRAEEGRLEDVHVTEIRNGEPYRRIEAERGAAVFDEENRQIVLKLEEATGFLWTGGSSSFESLDFRLDLEPVMRQLREPKLSEMTFSQLRLKSMELDLKGVESMPARVHMHKQLSGSFACVCFLLVGIPLGLRAHRRETIAGVAIALALVGVYYGLALFAQTLETKPAWRPDLLLWAPNALFLVVGAALLRRVNRWL